MKRCLFYLVLGLSISFSSVAFGQTFEKDLYFGMQNDYEVTRLQEFLTGQGIYKGPVTGNFFSITLEAVKQFQAQNGISPVAGYFGPKTRAVANAKSLASNPAAPVSLQEQITQLLKQVEALQKQLAESQAIPVQAVPEEKATTTVIVNAPVNSSLKISVMYSSVTLSTYGIVTLNQIQLVADEKIAITRIKFKNNGYAPEGSNFGDYFSNFQLIDADSGLILATVNKFENGFINFNLSADETKTNKNLMVSGGIYAIKATMLTPSRSSISPKIRLDIESVSDVSAFDYNDLSRSADIVKNNTFPIIGPTIAAF